MRLIEQLSVRIAGQLTPFVQTRELLETIPGIATRTAEVILAEISTDVKPFPTSEHLASWAGLCPGNNENAGKRRSGALRKGSVWLRTVLIQAAWAASRTKDTYLSSTSAGCRLVGGGSERQRRWRTPCWWSCIMC